MVIPLQQLVVSPPLRLVAHQPHHHFVQQPRFDRQIILFLVRIAN
jgi:hypothetical protein